MELNSLLLWWWWCCESQWWSGLHSNNWNIKNHSMISLFGPVFNVKKKMVEVTKCFIISFVVSLTDIFSIYSHSLCSHISYSVHLISTVYFICQSFIWFDLSASFSLERFHTWELMALVHVCSVFPWHCSSVYRSTSAANKLKVGLNVIRIIQWKIQFAVRVTEDETADSHREIKSCFMLESKLQRPSVRNMTWHPHWCFHSLFMSLPHDIRSVWVTVKPLRQCSKQWKHHRTALHLLTLIKHPQYVQSMKTYSDQPQH